MRAVFSILAATLATACGPRFEALQTANPAHGACSAPVFANARGSERFLAWFERSAATERAARLVCARWEGERFGAAHEIASSARAFVNWASAPALASASENVLAASWPEHAPAGGQRIDLHFSISTDAGSTWSAPRLLHDHEGDTEHGFVALAALDERSFAAAWLDGRRREGRAEGDGDTALYTRSLGVDGARASELLVDERVCDCCPTALAALADGSYLIAYRDRTANEQRDIVLTRVHAGAASELWRSRDEWRIVGCPVNGPALGVQGERVLLAWYSGTRGVRVAQFEANDWSAQRVRELERDTSVGGQVQVAHDGAGEPWILWRDARAEKPTWLLSGRFYRAEGGDKARHTHLPELAGGSTPRAALACAGNDALIALVDGAHALSTWRLRRP
jgi:hypothetical protein